MRNADDPANGLSGPGAHMNGPAERMDDPAARLRARVDQALAAGLTPSEIAELESHLGDCINCAREVERARRLQARLRASCREEPAPRELRERIRVTYREVRITYRRQG
ncbi:hypothetical protein [Helcobacillus massiliensis]|uniref:Mycothiol system anti-sigma-R factor n=1 Tax=Helcobacillus massiliensis TaxID=521392 RepID=A0A839QXH1_9MICO|nr:hypothetical protein [Helcobacillus massiliensis]MBB3022087.1 mycothiol system anti-sigma-R factor [Helcobacillus massiliensis]